MHYFIFKTAFKRLINTVFTMRFLWAEAQILSLHLKGFFWSTRWQNLQGNCKDSWCIFLFS